MEKNAPQAALKGIHAIVYALFDADEELSRGLMRQQVAHCHKAGVHGVAALGLATEVGKLSEGERRTVMDWLAEDNGGRAVLGLTIYGASVAEQIRQLRHAESVGADWVILQPPMAGKYSAEEYIGFFGRVADATGLPVAIQNAPDYMGRGLTAPELRALVARHSNIRLLKAEGSAVDVAQLIEIVGEDVAVFNGRGGLELIDNLKAGCAGFVLGMEMIDHAVKIYRDYHGGDISAAEETYRHILPAITFEMQSIENFVCYGKRIFAERAGIEIFDRSPALRPTNFGRRLVRDHAMKLGPLAL